MTDPFAAALKALFASSMARWADYTPAGSGAIRLRIIRDQGSQEVSHGQGMVLLDSNAVQIQRSDAPARPRSGEALAVLILDDEGDVIEQEMFFLQGDGELDVEGVTWRCALEPAP